MIHSIRNYIANNPREVKAAIAIASALSDEIKAIYGAALNLNTFIDQGQITATGVWQGIRQRNFRPIRNVAGNSIQTAIAGVLFVTGMFFSEVFKKVAATIGIAQNIFNLSTNQGPNFSKKQELAKLGINVISLAYELNPDAMHIAAKTTSQVAYLTFQSWNNFAVDRTDALRDATVAILTGIKGANKYVKTAEKEAQQAEEQKPSFEQVPQEVEKPIPIESPIDEEDRTPVIVEPMPEIPAIEIVEEEPAPVPVITEEQLEPIVIEELPVIETPVIIETPVVIPLTRSYVSFKTR